MIEGAIVMISNFMFLVDYTSVVVDWGCVLMN